MLNPKWAAQRKWSRNHRQQANAIHQRYRALHRGPDRAYAGKRQLERLSLVTAIKMEKGCVECGYNDNPEALEFDHLPGTVKVRAVSRLMGASEERLWEEISKCEVVCANCHRIRTSNRRAGGTV